MPCLSRCRWPRTRVQTSLWAAPKAPAASARWVGGWVGGASPRLCASPRLPPSACCARPALHCCAGRRACLLSGIAPERWFGSNPQFGSNPPCPACNPTGPHLPACLPARRSTFASLALPAEPRPPPAWRAPALRGCPLATHASRCTRWWMKCGQWMGMTRNNFSVSPTQRWLTPRARCWPSMSLPLFSSALPLPACCCHSVPARSATLAAALAYRTRCLLPPACYISCTRQADLLRQSHAAATSVSASELAHTLTSGGPVVPGTRRKQIKFIRRRSCQQCTISLNWQLNNSNAMGAAVTRQYSRLAAQARRRPQQLAPLPLPKASHHRPERLATWLFSCCRLALRRCPPRPLPPDAAVAVPALPSPRR